MMNKLHKTTTIGCMNENIHRKNFYLNLMKLQSDEKTNYSKRLPVLFMKNTDIMKYMHLNTGK